MSEASFEVRAIGVGGESRLSILPQLPTFAEQGLPGYSVKNWFGVVAAPGTPRGSIDKLAGEIRRIQGSPDFREKLADQGVEPFVNGPDQFAAFITSLDHHSQDEAYPLRHNTSAQPRRDPSESSPSLAAGGRSIRTTHRLTLPG